MNKWRLFFYIGNYATLVIYSLTHSLIFGVFCIILYLIKGYFIYSLIHLIIFIFVKIKNISNQKYILINMNIPENIIKSNNPL